MTEEMESDVLRFDDDADLIAKLRLDGKPRLKVYRPSEVRVILGHGSRIETEVFIDPIRADGVSLERRPGGGCAVVLDSGNVIVSVVLPVPGLGDTKKWFMRCTKWMADSLSKAGIPGVYVDGISDLVIEDRKIAGTALHRAKDLLYFSASLLVTPDLTLIERYLPHPPREPEYRASRGHLDFVTSLRDTSGVIDAAEFEKRLSSVLEINDLLALGME